MALAFHILPSQLSTTAASRSLETVFPAQISQFPQPWNVDIHLVFLVYNSSLYVHPFICFPILISFWLSVHLSTHHTSHASTHLSVHPASICTYILPRTYPSLHLTYVSIHSSAYLFISLSIYPSTTTPLPSIHPPPYPSVCLPIHPVTYGICLSHSSTHPLTITDLSTHQSTYLSIHACIFQMSSELQTLCWIPGT